MVLYHSNDFHLTNSLEVSSLYYPKLKFHIASKRILMIFSFFTFLFQLPIISIQYKLLTLPREISLRKFLFLFLIISLYLSGLNSYSQQPTQEWVARYSGPSNDAYRPFLQVDKDGNSYIAGTHVINDSINILCVKYNASGVQQWAALYKYPGNGFFQPSGLALDSSGNAYVIADYGPTYTVPLNGLIVKFNSPNGSPVWAKTYNGEYGWSSFRDIKIDRLNNIYVVGWSDTSHLVIRYNTNGDSVWVRKYHPGPLVREVSSASTLDDSLNIIFTGQRMHYITNPPNAHYDSLLVVKYSSSGVLRWESTYSSGLTNANFGDKITADQNGSIYVGGGTTPSGFGVFLTLKYDGNGAQQWVSIYDAPGSGDNNLRGIAMDRINNALFVTGGAVVNGTGVAATIKYNSLTGDSVWVRRDTGTYRYGDSRDIKLDTAGNIYIAGVSSNTGSGAPVDILTIKYSQTGVRNWFATYNGPFNGLDIGGALGLDALKNVYVLGISQSSTQVTDYVVIKYSQISGIKPISSAIPLLFNLKQNYPNPFNPSTKIKFSISKRSFVELRIYDILGRLKELPLSEYMNPSEYELTLDGSAYPSGTYFYQLIAGGRIVETRKMIVLK